MQDLYLVGNGECRGWRRNREIVGDEEAGSRSTIASLSAYRSVASLLTLRTSAADEDIDGDVWCRRKDIHSSR